MSGRLGTIYGHQRVALVGLFIFAFFSLANGFARSFDVFIAFRALSGIGGGIYMPNAVSVLSLTLPPGKARNMLFGLFAAAPPAGGLIGALLTGLCATWDGMWPWTVLFAAMYVFSFVVAWLTCSAVASAVCLGLLWWLMPPERPIDQDGKIDVVGALLGLSSLILYNVTWKYVSRLWNTAQLTTTQPSPFRRLDIAALHYPSHRIACAVRRISLMGTTRHGPHHAADNFPRTYVPRDYRRRAL